MEVVSCNVSLKMEVWHSWHMMWWSLFVCCSRCLRWSRCFRRSRFFFIGGVRSCRGGVAGKMVFQDVSSWRQVG
eukprot:12411073-Karenia_brevis.AAC.1